MSKTLIESLEKRIVELKEQVLRYEIGECYAKMGDLIKQYKSKLTEGFIDDHKGPLEAELDEVIRKLQVANRALGLANRLRDPSQKREHQSRVMKHINRINKDLARLGDQIYSGSPMSKGEMPY